MEETYQPKPFKCVPKIMEQTICGVPVMSVPHSCLGEPYLAIFEEGKNWELTGYIPEKVGMILGAAADLYSACEIALAILLHDEFSPTLDETVDKLKAAIAKARGKQ